MDELDLSALAPLNIIRTETVFSKLPVHNLAKQGRVDIRIARKGEDGEVDLRWEVSYSDRYGQARQLAYKLDTLIINRRIDDEKKPLPRIIRLGTLAHICRELGVPSSGKNTTDIRNAIHQNAGTYITAKLTYRGADGTERRIEAGFTRYSVVFTGETLPDGQVANGVHIILNDPYREVLNTAPLRPLNYDYLRQLRPAAQRFYEVISYRVFAALKNDRSTARITYSDYCLFSAQQRYFDHEHFRVQMYKVHKPHLDSGYLKGVVIEPAKDREGKPDWVLIYTPGPRAKAEYNTFTRKQTPLLCETESAPALPNPLLQALTVRGITPAKARTLLATLPSEQHLMDQLEWGDSIIEQAGPGAFRNPPGFYVSLIRDNIAPPETFASSRRRRLHQETQQQAEAQALEQQQLDAEYEQYRRAAVERALQEMSPAAFQSAVGAKRKHYQRLHPALLPQTLDEIAAGGVRTDIDKHLALMTLDEFRMSRQTSN